MSDDETYVTTAQYNKLVRYVKKLEKRLDERIGEAFEAITTGDNTQSEFWDEHEDKIARLQRANNRLSRRLDDLEAEE